MRFSDNSTGKTVLLKIMYSAMQSLFVSEENVSKDELSLTFSKKLQGVFRPDQGAVGRLVGRRQGSSRTSAIVKLDGKKSIAIGFGNHATKLVDVDLKGFQTGKQRRETQPVYLPPKEIISATENFQSLYEQLHIAFEETYCDLAKLLDRPLKKGPNTSEQTMVLEKFEHIMDGKVSQKDRKFFLTVQGSGAFEMGLVSEGYRKLSTIMYLISSDSLNKNSVLFWDEPETNMNPKMIQPIVEAVLELAKMGVQVFITTHDYFIQQEFNLAATYPNHTNTDLDIRFISLYKDAEGHPSAETAGSVSGLLHNSIMEEFDALYDREQEMLDRDGN